MQVASTGDAGNSPAFWFTKVLGNQQLSMEPRDLGVELSRHKQRVKPLDHRVYPKDGPLF